MLIGNPLFWIGLTLAPGIALAVPARLGAFRKAYPNAKAIVSCKLCHEAGPKLNYYGQDYLKGGMSFTAIEPLDSDGDLATNLQEISADTFPGDKTSTPAPSPTPVPAPGTCSWGSDCN